MMNWKREILAFVLVFCFLNASGQHGKDSIAPQTKAMADSVFAIEEVKVTGRLATRQIIEGQKLNGEQIERLSNNSVADALRYFSGLQVKDYGGVGGLKTVNIRSMGTNHLGVFYDGIELGNAQNGVIDLGQFSLDNVDEISVFNGQKSQIFQPAADFGNAGTVYIKTRRPVFSSISSENLKLRSKIGSSDMLNLSAIWDKQLTKQLISSVNFGFLTSSGKYKFRYTRQNIDGSIAYDTTATRQNGDIMAFRFEGNLHGILERGGWNVKLYTYQSGRGIPGAIVNNVWRRGERQSDWNTFLQGTWQKSIGNHFDTQLRMKYAYYNTHYINRDSTIMRVDNRYRQQEFYASSANAYEIADWWSMSMSYDLKWNSLEADLYNFAQPRRITNMVAAATAMDFGWMRMQGSVLGTFVNDRQKRSGNTANRTAFTPALFLNMQPTKWLDFNIYAKQSYRMPTFNDLYYTEMGNASLNSERATQYSAELRVQGAGNREQGVGSRVGWNFAVKGYYNTVKDKIVAYPKGQQFRWTMLNLGEVRIKGIDVEAEIATVIPVSSSTSSGGIKGGLRLQYTYQEAIDVTNPANSFYKHQIPYIPWHSGSAIINAEWHGFSVNYSFIYTGKRYCQQENIRRNEMLPWYTSDLSLSWKRKDWRITLDVNNLLSQDYDVIINYPMPKRNYAFTVAYDI